MEVTLYKNFSKRKNSTKQPTDASYVTKEVTLKGQCSVTNPSFFLADTTAYTYLQWNGVYYFIDDRKFDINGASYIECSIDVLATWKSQILATSAFVRFSTSNYDENVIDSRVAQDITTEYSLTTEESLFSTNGCYIISTVNNDTYYGGVTSYAVEETALKNILNYLMDDSSVWGSLEQIFSDVSSGILSCRYVPVPISNFYSTQGANVVIGDWDSGEMGYVTDGLIRETISLEIPWIYSDFRRCNTFTRFILSLPFIGCVDIEPSQLVGNDTLQIFMVCNAVTGVINYRVAITGHYLNTYSGAFGRTVPISTSQLDINGALSGLTTQVGGVLGGGIATGAMELGLATTPAGQYALAAGMLQSGTQLLKGILQSTASLHTADFKHVGGFGGGYGERVIPQYQLITIAFDSRTLPSELAELYGRPCYKVLEIGTLSGYVETSGFSIDIDATTNVRDAINTAMDNGVYIE